jgi:predicted nucleic acid-binding protein
MVVVFDNNVLCLLLHPEADVPDNPETGRPVDRAQDRMSHLVEQLREQGARILIPTPVLSEFLTFASAEYLTVIHESTHFEIAAFDQRAAIEASAALRHAIKCGQGKKLGLVGNWQKIKIDRQVVAIAKVNGAETIYTTDRDIQALAKDSGLQTIHVADLQLPPSTTPLLDTAAEVSEPVSSSTSPQPPPGQSPSDELEIAGPPAPVHPSALPSAQEPQPQDSSRHAVPRPPSAQ